MRVARRALTFAALLQPVCLACSDLPALDDPRVGTCGDSLLQPGEECDSGPANSDSGFCTASCRHARCGDGLLGPGETCDDGNDAVGDGCEGCRSPSDASWVVWLDGAESVGASPDQWVYVGGRLSQPGGASVSAVVALDGPTGTVVDEQPWEALEERASAYRGTLGIRPHPDGGAVIAGHFSYGWEAPVAVTAWFELAAGLASRYESPQAQADERIERVAVSPRGLTALAGARAGAAWVAVIDRSRVVWEAREATPGVEGVATAVDLDEAGAAVVGSRAGSTAWLALYDDEGARVWRYAVGSRGQEDTVRDLRFESDAVMAAMTWRDADLWATVERIDLRTGTVQGSIVLGLPPGIDLAGVRLLPDDRALTYGRAPDGPWIALHAPDGSVTWRANPTEIRADVLEVASADATWVYAIVGGVSVMGWHVGD